MTAQEQLTWLQTNHATVWFSRNGVKVRADRSAISGKTLAEAIANVERIRKEQRGIWETYESLKREG